MPLDNAREFHSNTVAVPDCSDCSSLQRSRKRRESTEIWKYRGETQGLSPMVPKDISRRQFGHHARSFSTSISSVGISRPHSGQMGFVEKSIVLMVAIQLLHSFQTSYSAKGGLRPPLIGDLQHSIDNASCLLNSAIQFR